MKEFTPKRSALKGKNLLPLGANSFLLEQIPFQKGGNFDNVTSTENVPKGSALKGKNLLPLGANLLPKFFSFRALLFGREAILIVTSPESVSIPLNVNIFL